MISGWVCLKTGEINNNNLNGELDFKNHEMEWRIQSSKETNIVGQKIVSQLH
jgi:hypothetical protein